MKWECEMTLKFVNESPNAAWNALADGLTADFAGLIWIGKCSNPLEAYNDSWPATKPLYQIAIQLGTEPGEFGRNKRNDATDLDQPDKRCSAPSRAQLFQ